MYLDIMFLICCTEMFPGIAWIIPLVFICLQFQSYILYSGRLDEAVLVLLGRVPLPTMVKRAPERLLRDDYSDGSTIPSR